MSDTICEGKKYRCKLKKISEGFGTGGSLSRTIIPPVFECTDRKCGKHYVLDIQTGELKEID